MSGADLVIYSYTKATTDYETVTNEATFQKAANTCR